MDIWRLIQEGHFEEACKIADSEYAQSKNLLLLRNKVYALFHLKKYEEAYQLGNSIIEVNGGESDVDFVFSGIALWLLDRKKEAIERWGNTEEAHYKDAAGGVDVQVLLYFGAVKTGDGKLKTNVLKVIRKLVKPKRNGGWPTPLGAYILGEITEEELYSRIVSIPILRERQLCQAHFVVAIKELEKGNTSGYLKGLADCISYGPPSYLEQFYYLAKGELELSNTSK